MHTPYGTLGILTIWLICELVIDLVGVLVDDGEIIVA